MNDKFNAIDKSCRKMLMFVASLFDAETRIELEEELNRMSPLKIIVSSIVCNTIVTCIAILFIYTVGV